MRTHYQTHQIHFETNASVAAAIGYLRQHAPDVLALDWNATATAAEIETADAARR